MLEATGLSKRYGQTLAVDDVSFAARAGQVTALVGPAGAGKTTILRLALGLTRGQGVALFDGREYRALRCPAREVGVSLDPAACHPARLIRSHLRMLAAAARAPAARVDEALDLVGLAPFAHERFRRMSPAMAQRLGLAAALLGDPRTLVLDEPTAALDETAFDWLRALLRAYAAEGRAVVLTTSALAEAASLADHLVVLRAGRVIADAPASQLKREAAPTVVLVRTPHADRLGALLDQAGATTARDQPTVLAVTGLSRHEVGEIAFTNGVMLHELSERPSRLSMPFLGVATEREANALDHPEPVEAPAARGSARAPGDPAVAPLEPWGAPT